MNNKFKLVAVTVLGAALLTACGTDTEEKDEKATEDTGIELGENLATIKGEEFGSGDILGGLVEQGIVSNDMLVQAVLNEVLAEYFPATEEEVDKKIEELKKFEKASGNEVDEEQFEQNRPYITESVQLQKALDSVVDVTDEQKDAIYESIKEKYDVIDILVFSEEGAELGKEILEQAKTADKEELDALVEKYADNQEVHVDVMSYAKGEIPVEDQEQLDAFNEKGDVIETEGEEAYNAILLSKVTTIEREGIEDRLHEAALYEQIGTTADILKLLEENLEDLTLSEDAKKLLETEQPETGVQGGEELDEELIEEAIEESEGEEAEVEEDAK